MEEGREAHTHHTDKIDGKGWLEMEEYEKKQPNAQKNAKA